MIRFKILGSALLFLTATVSWAMPAQVLIIRHAEKDGGSDLSPQGYQHAQALVQYFQTNADVTQYGTPAAIFAEAPKGPDGSRRAIETVTPLATALGLPVQDEFTKKHIQELVTLIESSPQFDGRMVLICWEHKVIDQMAAAFGVNPMPDPYPSSRFDLVWEINFSGDQVSSFREFSQNL